MWKATVLQVKLIISVEVFQHTKSQEKRKPCFNCFDKVGSSVNLLISRLLNN